MIRALLALVVCLSVGAGLPWGFYVHRLINRNAVYTLPAPLARFYKPQIEYVSAHAVDPDKRRYAATLEAPRHFIDLERFGDGTVDSLPLSFWEFHDRYTDLRCVRGADSLPVGFDGDSLRAGPERYALHPYAYADWYRERVLPNYWQELTSFGVSPPATGVDTLLRCERYALSDTMMQHGILPYQLEASLGQLTEAFRQNEPRRILQLSAELGHYLGDATVPLHTTVNYNGQLTGQLGIHALWESRLPELFAESEYDRLVGPAAYIADKSGYFRALVAGSHALVDSALLIEAGLRARLPEEMQTCYEERLGRIARVPCEAFARAYANRLDGMVERQFRVAILAVGSAWYTAWVDAGQPVLGVARATERVDTLGPGGLHDHRRRGGRNE